MTLNDHESTYGWVSIAFHWIGAALVVALFLIGEQMEELARGPERTETLALHVSIGAIAVVILGARILWRLFQRGPRTTVQHPAVGLLSGIVQWGLLAAIGILILSGPLIQWSIGRSVDVFGLVSIRPATDSSQAAVSASRSTLPLLSEGTSSTVRPAIVVEAGLVP